MARKVKFALEMADGTKVRSNLEELREHFDMESIVSYYLSGKLLEWLEDRYYDDEAAKIEELDKDAPNLNAQLCAIIGVDASEFDALDVEAVERLNEKKSILRQKTSDSTIIDNAMITALNQEDLADLLDLESPVIYLCGEKFNIPIRVEHKKYIGILGTPKVEIRASSDADLKEKDILFENVELPWKKQVEAPLEINDTTPLKCNENIYNEELFELWNTSAIARRRKYKGNSAVNLPWETICAGGVPDDIDIFNSAKINIALRTVCQGKYTEKDIVKALIADDFSSACIFTTDSVCLFDKNGMAVINAGGNLLREINDPTPTTYIIPYTNIKTINDLKEALIIATKDDLEIVTPDSCKDPMHSLAWSLHVGMIRNRSTTARTDNAVWKLATEICNFLNAVKTI